MENAFNTVILSFVLVLALGFLLRTRGVFGPADSKTINRILFNIALPALVIEAVLSSDVSSRHLNLALLGFAVIPVLFLASWVVGGMLRLPPPAMGAFVLASALGNTAFLGLPLIRALYGSANLVWAVFFDYSLAISMLTAGVFIARHYGREKSSTGRKFISLPSLLVLPIAVLLKQFALPAPATEAIALLSAATTPLVMLSIAFSLELKLPSRIGGVVAAVAIKSLLAPLAAGTIGHLLGLRGTALEIGVLQASMPTAMIAVILSQEYKLDSQLAATTMVFSLLVSVLSLPLVIKGISLLT